MDDHHELTAGYALDALDPQERERYEAHLATCEECREELGSFWSVSGALAHAAGGPPPTCAARADPRAGALRASQRRSVPAATIYSPGRRDRGGRGRARPRARALGDSVSRELDDAERELAVLGDPNARTSQSSDGVASLVVRPTGEAALVVRTLTPAPDGKDYEIWVFENGVPQRAGLFEQPGVALLTHRVEPGQMVAVTLEADGGVDAPTGAPLFTASSA